MCVGIISRWACGTQTVNWNFCRKGIEEGNRPCEWAAQDQAGTIEYNNCCSTSCCQIDIDAKVQAAVDMENEFRTLLRKAGREGIPIGLRTALRAAEVAEETSEENLRNSLKYHFYGCVQQVDTKHKLGNRDKLNIQLAPKLPWELRIPSHREVSSKDRDEFERMLNDWENSEYVKSERALYYEHIARQRHEQQLLEQEQRQRQRQQWQQESQWLDSNLRTVQDYQRSLARHRYRPILPANDIPPLFAPGARGSRFPPQTEASPSRTSSVDELSAYSSQPSSRSQSRASHRSLSQAEGRGENLICTRPRVDSRPPKSDRVRLDWNSDLARQLGGPSFGSKIKAERDAYEWK